MSRGVRLLIAEGQFDDVFQIDEVLTEMAGGAYWRTWMQDVDPVFTDRLEDTLRMLREDNFDAILLSLDLPDCPGLHAVMRIRAESPSTPVVILAGGEDQVEMATTAVREGAHDWVLKARLDPATLARVLRHALDRHRLCDSLRRASFVDELTGLYNQGGFLAFAEHDIRLSAQSGHLVSLMIVELLGGEVFGPAESSERLGRSQLDLAMMEAAELLRQAFPEQAVVGRLGADRFGVLATAVLGPLPLERMLRAHLHDHNSLTTFRCRLYMATGCATLDGGHRLPALELLRLAESALCENKRGRLPDPVPAVSAFIH